MAQTLIKFIIIARSIITIIVSITIMIAWLIIRRIKRR